MLLKSVSEKRLARLYFVINRCRFMCLVIHEVLSREPAPTFRERQGTVESLPQLHATTLPHEL